ncbi:hypothetical protein B0H12DRAFT_1321731 [Mycena haematopus]|nr:hypothetical protein B0H12DRAFT_1321731 [Mycena haematopus]
MSSGSGYSHRNDRGPDGRRNRDSESQSRPTRVYDPSGSGGFPPPEGKHIRFDNEMDDRKQRKGTPTPGSKRERSRERNSASHESSRSHRDRDRDRHSPGPERRRDFTEPSKRLKRDHVPDTPTIPGDFSVRPDSSDELDLLRPPAEQVQSSRRSRTPAAPEVAPSRSEAAAATLDRYSPGLFTTFYNKFLAKSQEERGDTSLPDSHRVQDAHGAQELGQAREKCRALQEQVQTLQAGEERARVEIEHLTAEKQSERARLMGKCNETSDLLQWANADVHSWKQRLQDAVTKYDARVEALTDEKKNYVSELRELHDKYRALEERFQMLQASKQDPPADIQRLDVDYAELVRKCSEQSKYINEADAHIHSLMETHQATVTDYESRISTILLDGGDESSQLREAQERSRTLQEQVRTLQASEKHLKAGHDRLMAKWSEKSKAVDRAQAHIRDLTEERQDLVDKYEARFADLVERGKHRSQLKPLPTHADTRPPTRPKADIVSLDPFDNKLDQISEMEIKSGVESLNDSIDHFTMVLIDEAEKLATQNSHSVIPAAVPVHEITKLLVVALSEHSQVEEKRGFFLDANFHHELVSELNRLFFSGDVVSHALDEGGVFALTLPELTKREPWTVVQRWRALAAGAIGTGVFHSSAPIWTDSITCFSEATVHLLAFAYRQPPQTFEPLLPNIRSRLETLYTEANQISIVARRDVLSVRMTVVVAPTGAEGLEDYLPYNTDFVASVWPDMKLVESDKIIALYKFGLNKTHEGGRVTCLIKPEVVTTALLREMAKN